jgi:hypothetical protein
VGVLNNRGLLHNVGAEGLAAEEDIGRIEGHFEGNRKGFFAFVDEEDLVVVVEEEEIRRRLLRASPVYPGLSHRARCTSEVLSESPSRRWDPDSVRLGEVVRCRDVVVGLKEEDSRGLLVSSPPKSRLLLIPDSLRFDG